MSGTGNTYRLACWMKEMAGLCMQEIKIVMIDEAGAGHSWAVILYFLASIPVLSYLLYRLGVVYYKILGPGGSFFYELINYLDLFIAIFISYWVFWNLTRIPLVNKIFTFTTLTHYYRRYHQPEIRLKQMAPHKKGAKHSPER